MALSSPGVQVSVIDESFYTPAAPGTVPMIFVATAENKLNGAGTGIAQGTLAANVGKPYLITSQRELVDTFGDPVFYADSNNNQIHGGELNEYGLQAAYSYLGVSSRAYVVRAGIDLSELQASASAPYANPAANTYWFDIQNTAYGIFEWNGAAASARDGQTFVVKYPIVIASTAMLVDNTAGNAPKASVGAIGEYAIVATTGLNTLYYKNTQGAWVVVGSEEWKQSHAIARFTGSLTAINTPDVTLSVTVTAESGTQTQVDITVLAGDENTDGGFVEAFNTAMADYNCSAATVQNGINFYTGGAALQFTGGTALSIANSGLVTNQVYNPVNMQISAHTQIPEYKLTAAQPRPTGSLWVKTTEPNRGAKWRVNKFNAETNLWDTVPAPIFTSPAAALVGLDKSGGGINLSADALYVRANVGEYTAPVADFTIYKRASAGALSVTSGAISGVTANTYSFILAETVPGSAVLQSNVVEVTTAEDETDADTIAGAVNAAGFAHVQASIDSANRVVIKHLLGGEIHMIDSDGLLNAIGFDTAITENLYAAPAGSDYDYVASLWTATNAYGSAIAIPSATAPNALAQDGQLWYSSIVDEVDIMINDGEKWVGYRSSTSPFAESVNNRDRDGFTPIVSASEPETGADGDLWVSTADLQNYPLLYKRVAGKWQLVDKADQTTDDGIIFADARAGLLGGSPTEAPRGTIAELATSDYVDADAPDPALYPKGMMLWNLRKSGFNVKRFVRNYVDVTQQNLYVTVTDQFGAAVPEPMTNYYPHRWVTESANQEDGSGSFGQVAQRKVVVQSLQALVNNNQEIRDDESRVFNLMACPGYPELIGEMIGLNYDRGLSAFIVGDSPARLTPDATTLNEWGNNVNLAVEDNEKGLVSMDEYMAVFYPWGFTSDNFGNNVVVPPSHMMLRTIALSDQVSYPWFAPAGTRRGGITNATATGYISAEGEFVTVALNEGQRDTLAGISVNPITFITGAGLVNFGQKTRARNASALDRINVARLVVYLRGQLNRLAKPYLFEPNDKITRDEIKQAAESLLLELVGQRALYDYLVVCDESNNTPSRIDRNELYLDIAIEPVKAVEMIYIPMRLKNTGEIAGL
jgi:hypothetical protein